MRIPEYNNTQTPAAPAFEAPAAGAYPCVITEVEDHPKESYLRVKWDIAEGPYKGYYSRLRAEHPDWKDHAEYRKYYTPAALKYFHRFCNAASRSNGSYVFDGKKINCDERTLVGKKIGLVLQAREYYKNTGDLGLCLEVLKEIPVDRVPYEPVPSVLTIAKQEEIKARKAARQSTPAPAQPAPAPAQAFAQQAAQPAPVQPAPQQAQAQQPTQPQPVYQQSQAAPAGYQQTQTQTQQQAMAGFVQVPVGSPEQMPFA